MAVIYDYDEYKRKKEVSQGNIKSISEQLMDRMQNTKNANVKRESSINEYLPFTSIESNESVKEKE